MSFDRVTLALKGRIHVTATTVLQRSSPDNATPQVDNYLPTSSEYDHTVQRNDDQYVIDRIVDDEDHSKDQLYRVRWYVYDLSEDTLEPRSALPDNFVRRYLSHAKHI